MLLLLFQPERGDGTGRQTERDRQTDTDRLHRQRETDRQTDRQRQRETDTRTERRKEGENEEGAQILHNYIRATSTL